jgi:hypothetical protein
MVLCVDVSKYQEMSMFVMLEMEVCNILIVLAPLASIRAYVSQVDSMAPFFIVCMNA